MTAALNVRTIVGTEPVLGEDNASEACRPQRAEGQMIGHKYEIIGLDVWKVLRNGLPTNPNNSTECRFKKGPVCE